MRVVVAPGFGKLHFHETARALAAAGVEVNFLTGWVPKPSHARMVDALGSALLNEHNLSKRLRARSIEVDGATVTPSAWAEAAATIVSRMVHARLLPESSFGGTAFRIAARASRKHMKNADALLVRSGAGGAGALETARRNGLAIVTDHSIAHPAFLDETLRDEFRRARLRFGFDSRWDLWKLVLGDCRRADLLMVNSDFVKKTFVDRGYPAEKIRVVYLGVRESFFHLKRGYTTHGKLQILFTGNFEIRKGARFLLEAIRRCRAKGLDANLHIVGNLDEGRESIENTDAEFITHTPFIPQEELPAVLARSDLFAFPTLAEGSSRSAMEAAAAGLPVITTENCGLPLEDGKSVVYVPIKDAAALAAAITRLASDAELRRRLGQSAAQSIAENHTWPAYGRQARSVLEEAIEQRKHSIAAPLS